MKLYEKGLSADDSDNALVALEPDHADPELTAAIKLARRRRLGPYADPHKREATLKKDLATLPRAGFSYDMAKKVIEAEDPQELEDQITPPPFTGSVQ